MITLHANNSPQAVMLSIPLDRVESWTHAAETVNELLRKGFERDGGDARLFDKLVRQATVLTNTILTAEQVLQLAELPEGTSLTVTAPLSQLAIPWELLRIGNQFLCERFAVGRIDSDCPCGSGSDATESRTGSVTVLIAEAWELISTNTERTIVERRLRQLSHDFPEKLTTLNSLLAPMQADTFCKALEDARWLHFAGHAMEIDGVRCLGISNDAKRIVPDATSQSSGITEAGSENAMGILRPTDLKDLSSAPEIVFLNACGALQLPSDVKGIAQESLVSELLRLGTRWLIGPVVPVLDSQTRHITTEFYDAIGRGCSMGEAVRQARLHARKKLGPHNLLPLSYVFYGDPSVSLFPERASMFPALDFDPLIATAVSDLTLPCICSRCGTFIETRHGLGSHVAASSPESVICRGCARQRRPDVPRDASLVRPFLPAAPAAIATSWNPADVQVMAAASSVSTAMVCSREMSNAEKAFRQHVGECLTRNVSWMDLRTGKKVNASFHQLEPANQNTARSGLAELDRSLSAQAHPTVQRYAIQSHNGRNIGSVTVVIVQESTGHNMLPMTSEALVALMTSLNAEIDGSHDYVFVCSINGFAQDCLQQLAAELAPSWYGDQRSILLHDVASQRTHFRTVDLSAHGLANVLHRESTNRQFQQALTWLENQLPLVTSVSSEHVAKQLKLEADAVESAIRCVASQHNLVLEQTADFGLVMSEQTLSESGSGVLTSGHSTSVTEKAMKVILWPVAAMGRILRWLFL